MPKPDWESTRRELIETYRLLNTDFRGQDEARLSAGGDSSVKEVVRRMRDDELLFAKALTDRLAGIELTGELDPEDKPLIGNEVEDASTAILISQFGSARATTLNTMVSAGDDDWDRQLDGSRRLIDLAKELVDRDRTNIEAIRGAVKR